MNDWKKKMAKLNCAVELTEDGFLYVAGPSTYQPTWSEVGSVFQSEHLFIFCDEGDENALLIPKRAFASEEESQAFIQIAYQKTELVRR